MNGSVIAAAVARIVPSDSALAGAVQARLDNLTKPPGSLGVLEDLARRYCLARGSVRPGWGRLRLCCFAGDHGVTAERVSAYPREVTPQMVLNMLRGGAAVSVLARHAGVELVVVDVGVDADFDPAPGLERRKVRRGTDNIALGPAMSRSEAEAAIGHGLEVAARGVAEGVVLFGTGDMGIANTTPSSALFAAYLGLPPEDVVGRGTGVDDDGVRRKADVVRRALEVNRARLGDPCGVLAALGGCEIAGICGLILGAAAARIPVVVDGFISTAGALAALRMAPAAADYLFFGHLSRERGHRAVMSALGARPILDLDMRLGEGTGAALAMGVVSAAMKVYNEMATFDAAGVSQA